MLDGNEISVAIHVFLPSAMYGADESRCGSEQQVMSNKMRPSWRVPFLDKVPLESETMGMSRSPKGALARRATSR